MADKDRDAPGATRIGQPDGPGPARRVPGIDIARGGAKGGTVPGVVAPVPASPTRGAADDTLPADASDSAAALPAQAPTLGPGGRYRLGAELGRGGMGRVVEAFDTQLGRTVALKEVLPRGGESIARRFVREVQLTARLEHPSIVPLYDFGETEDGRPFYVMRRVTGQPLDELIGGTVGLNERLVLLPNVLAAIDAIAHAHRRGVIHRDLKPANILLGGQGETVVIDWGLAKVIGEADDPALALGDFGASESLQTQIGAVFGTPGFMAPEQARGEELGPHGDVYALGATLYQLLAGKPPISGPSATEVIDRTRKHEMKPLGEVAPGTPPELAAIVEKALAFDPKDRYRDAAALGEDVRRFLGGQLVAAHHYTRRQRVARFARKNRAPLGVAALASLAVAVMSWVGIHRIVAERDAARTAREAEAEGKRVAEHALAESQARADALVIAQAHAFVETSPTKALALLKSLPVTSPKLPDARGTAQSAVARGAAWALQSTDELTTQAELSNDGNAVLQVSRDGVVRVWDVERRRLSLEHRFGTNVRAIWVLAGTQLLVTGPADFELLDPGSDTVVALDHGELGPITFALADTAGDRVVLEDKAGAGWLDVKTRKVTRLWAGHAVDEIAISGDGSWFGLGDRRGAAVVHDADDHELWAKPDAQVLRFETSRFGEFVVLGGPKGDHLTLCTKPAAGACTEIDATDWLPNRALDLSFREHALQVFVTNGNLYSWSAGKWYEQARPGTFSFRIMEAADDLSLIATNEGKVYYTGQVDGVLELPSAVPNLKIAARAGSTRIVLVGKGILLGFDLDDVLPKIERVPIGHHVTFVGDDELLLWSNSGSSWEWRDLATGKSTVFDYPLATIPMVVDADPRDGRVLSIEGLPGQQRLALLRRGETKVQTLVEGANVFGKLLPPSSGADLLFGAGDGRVFAVVGSAPPRVLATLSGVAQDAVLVGRTGFSAISNDGEWVTGDLVSGQLDRAKLPTSGAETLGTDGRDRPLVGIGDKLYVWDGQPLELARFGKSIAAVVKTQDGALVVLSTNEVDRVGFVPSGPITRVMPPSESTPWISADGRVVLGETTDAAMSVLEVPTGIAWQLPVKLRGVTGVAIAPSARRFALSSYDTLQLFRIPEAAADFDAWLDEQTNAVMSADNVLAWPWQLPPGVTGAR
ncbi:MAG TPA: serine/threonine-protein kinase [Kofleriaceae bacterium]|jgi:hypothetical protein